MAFSFPACTAVLKKHVVAFYLYCFIVGSTIFECGDVSEDGNETEMVLEHCVYPHEIVWRTHFLILFR